MALGSDQSRSQQKVHMFSMFRHSVIATAFVSLVGTILTLIATFPTLIIGRVLQGICIGIYTSVIPVFINEISPLELTGALGTLSSIFITTGIIVTNILAIFVEDWDPVNPKESGLWRVVFGVPLVAGVLQIVLLGFVWKEETPRYLIEQARE